MPLCRDSTWHWLLLVNSIPKQRFFHSPAWDEGRIYCWRKKSGSHGFGGFVLFVWVSYLFVVFFFKHITEEHNLSSKKHSNNTGHSLGLAPVLAQIGVKQKHTISAISLSNLQPRKASSKVTSKHSSAGKHQQERQVGTQTSLKSRALRGQGKECTQPPGHSLRDTA